MTDLVQFLRARLDEDASVARTAGAELGEDWRYDADHGWVLVAREGYSIATGSQDFLDAEHGHHIARHDPARVLAEVDAKRRRLARHTSERRRLALEDADGTTSMAFLICASCTPNRVIRREEQDIVEWPCPDLLDDAAVYADHPDYREEWWPEV
ncbi:DUF6221 family protein [Streptomyces sp. PCS3-D2]|uniref:DUF6221 family protein n=1 Tax=Streptomyces sp. PCS3-D2 TaxID=1460244 RepID=UPI0004504C72|nr:DUF6221 family protein [Streptomyces sp. PCS3-D2]WKV74740.1 DUF6221 family protein [Streptomyces sp. PCS3-D2]